MSLLWEFIRQMSAYGFESVHHTQELVLAFTTYGTAALVGYAYARENRNADVLFAAIAVTLLGTSYLVIALGLSKAIAGMLNSAALAMAVVSVSLLGLRVLKGAKEYWGKFKKRFRKEDRLVHQEEDDEEDKAA